MANTKLEIGLEQISEPIKINLDVDMRMPRITTLGVDKKYKCSCCGKSWNNPKGHFNQTTSPLYQANDGYITVCNDCRDLYYTKLVEFYSGNEAHAIKHYCGLFDIIFDQNAFSSSRANSSSVSRISSYMSRKNLGQTTKYGTTYTDGLKVDYAKDQNKVIQTLEQAKSDDNNVKASVVERWGFGFSEGDYDCLETHYKFLKKTNPNIDSNAEIFVKTLCNLYMLGVRALQKGDSKEYTNISEQYAKTFKQAGLKTVEEKDSSNDEVFGVTLATISQYTPEEFYSDKSLYADWDGIGEYYERHVLRPTINILSGSEDRDKEFFVPENGDSDED